MKNQKKTVTISAEAVELSHLRLNNPLNVVVGENTLIVVPERMTAIQAVNTIGALTEFASDLIDAVNAACGSCGDEMDEDGCPYEEIGCSGKCPYETVEGPGVFLSDEARRQMGIPLDAKLELYPDEGEGLVAAADYEHDITDVPDNLRALLAIAGVCLGRLDEKIMAEEIVYEA